MNVYCAVLISIDLAIGVKLALLTWQKVRQARRAIFQWSRNEAGHAANDAAATLILRGVSLGLALPLYGRIFGWW